ncbi:MAG: alpha/beta fold hydrolase [Candidatus Hodarchaeales archaeon]|jgi:proline iminopeptidase
MKTTEEIIRINSVKLWINRSGNGKPFLFLLGGPGLTDYLSPFADLFTNHFQMVRFEQRGVGKSEKKPPYDIESTIQDIEAIKHHLGFDNWLVGGHSAGGNLALAYALQYPDSITGIVYVAGIGIQRNKEWLDEIAKNREERVEVLPDFDFQINEDVQKGINLSWSEYVQQPDLFLKISRLNKPVLIIQGEKDLRPNWPAKQLSYLLPNASYVEIEGAEHWFWNTHPNELKNHILSFTSHNDLI